MLVPDAHHDAVARLARLEFGQAGVEDAREHGIGFIQRVAETIDHAHVHEGAR
ncbi:hypothetical protein D3C81_2294850 [compost metagenome]